MKQLLSILFLLALAAPSWAVSARGQLAYCHRQTLRALTLLRADKSDYDFTQEPRNILAPSEASGVLPPSGGRGGFTRQGWNTRKACAEEWCSGFWPGILWMDYAATRDETVRKAAEGYTAALLPITRQPAYDHDLGFIVINSFLKGYEATGRDDYRQAALRAADTLATLYNPRVGTILSWPRHVKDYGGHNTIMDNMINLELLLWAADNGGSERLRDIAIAHATTTMHHHFRPDGSCYHVAVYDTLTGQFIKGVTHQGYSDASMWARGQSWAIYGYTTMYRYTRRTEFLAFAEKVTDIYLKRLRATSDTWVPLWDMDDPRGTAAPRDASAACVVASALLDLSTFVSKEKGKEYRRAAEKMLCDLSSKSFQSREKNTAFLLHSTGHHPAGSEIDASIIYADYYYIEALLKLNRK